MKFIRPRRMPEANIQAEIYRGLRNRGVKCCLEYKHRLNNNKFIRADIAVIKDDQIILFIECKSRKEGAEPFKEGRQYNNYSNSGVDFIYCMNWLEIQNTIKEVLNRM